MLNMTYRQAALAADSMSRSSSRPMNISLTKPLAYRA